jgi:Na+-transporting NADH:ubiquinone oxidoreductase subunit A
MNIIHLKKGYNLKIDGRPTMDLEVLLQPQQVALLPEHIPFIKPRLLVQVDEAVAVGTPVIEDKRHPDIKFLSPGGGKIAEINFGPRRVIREIVIQLDSEESKEPFEVLSENDLAQMDRAQLVQMVIKGGLWTAFKELPFRDYPQPDTVPPAIYVQLDSLEPFQPDPEVYLDGKLTLFNLGMQLLTKLTDKVYVAVGQEKRFAIEHLESWITHTYSGRYPAHDAGVLLYRTKQSANENRAWTIKGQDLLLLAELLTQGRYPTERTMSVAGSLAPGSKHIRSRLGVPIQHLLPEHYSFEKTPRYIIGGVLTGYSVPENSHMGMFETSLTIIPEGFEKGEFLGFVLPGYKRHSYSRTFTSFLNPNPLKMDCNRHGGLRACIACNYCTEVCPVDILPQLTYKAILVEEVEEYLEHGLLDCVECGLCSYVCPSKIELAETLKKAKSEYHKEMA